MFVQTAMFQKQLQHEKSKNRGVQTCQQTHTCLKLQYSLECISDFQEHLFRMVSATISITNHSDDNAVFLGSNFSRGNMSLVFLEPTFVIPWFCGPMTCGGIPKSDRSNSCIDTGDLCNCWSKVKFTKQTSKMTNKQNYGYPRLSYEAQLQFGV